MNPTIKRGLAISAVTALGFLAAAGPASARSAQNVDAAENRQGNVVFADCDFPNGDYDFTAAIVTEGPGGTDDAFDIDSVGILFGQNNSQTRVKRVVVEYWNENRTEEQVTDREVRADYRERDRPHGNDAYIGADHDNIEHLMITVRWKIDEVDDWDDNDNDDEHDFEISQCYVHIPG